MHRLLFVAIPIFVTGCAGKVDYFRPTTQFTHEINVKIIDRPRDVVWNASVPELGKQFFVINNLDKSSGLMNISYTGNPERYIDCGRITSYVKNVRGERTYDFSAAKAQQSYEVMDPSEGLFYLDRRMNLEGRVNLIFEEISSNKTRVTANTRYVVTRIQVVQSAAKNIPQTKTDMISFNSGYGASFPVSTKSQAAECVSTGVLEREILSAVK